ncbi:hypothetical protein QO021_28675 (plasmid) [Pseudomonas amygdali pv. lachrymans]|nr:hypothetical protein [Pseudomonas amygdali]KPC02277.1 Unknown protein sequence [Pseudomonas amygdali pv. lachrymans]WIO61535.1 hypothetical protein QO021_28675 [Pseudomonas amygdali pv. lachrymans]
MAEGMRAGFDLAIWWVGGSKQARANLLDCKYWNSIAGGILAIF